MQTECSGPAVLAAAGLTPEQAAERLQAHGRNLVDQSKPPSTARLAYRALCEPFNGLMLIVAVLTVCPPNSSYPTFVLIMASLLYLVFLLPETSDETHHQA